MNDEFALNEMIRRLAAAITDWVGNYAQQRYTIGVRCEGDKIICVFYSNEEPHPPNFMVCYRQELLENDVTGVIEKFISRLPHYFAIVPPMAKQPAFTLAELNDAQDFINDIAR